MYFVRHVLKPVFWQPIVFGKVFKRLNVAVRERRDFVYELEQCLAAFAARAVVVHTAELRFVNHNVIITSILNKVNEISLLVL